MDDVRDRLRQASSVVWPPGPPFERLVERRDRRRRHERVVAAVVAMALAVGVLGGVLFELGRTGSREVRNPSGTTASVGRQSTGKKQGQSLALGEGQYLYVRWRQVMPGWSFVQQSWWATDGSGRIHFECSTNDCMNPNCGPDYCDGYSGPPHKRYGPGDYPTDADMTGLSTDPQRLLDQLLERTAPGGRSPEPAVSPGPDLTPGVTVGGLLYAIGNLLEDPNGTPELKAAIFEVASGVEGVTVKMETVDPVGRPATVLEFPGADGTARDYFFDPDTRLLMAVASAGDESTYAVYDQGIVDSTDAPPTGGQWLFPESPQPSPGP